MFNLLVSTNPWVTGRAVYQSGRVLQPGYTDVVLINRFTAIGMPDLEAMARHPALFVEETYRHGPNSWRRLDELLTRR